MTTKELKKIREITSLLRHQILSHEIRFIGSDDFPDGCCGNVSQDYLIHRMNNEGFKETLYVNGYCDKYNTHGWLEYKGYIIDITADQFPEMKNHPIVIIKKEESEFHKQFTKG